MNADWKILKLSELVNFNTGRLDSNASVENGKYPFFTCSPVTLSINSFSFDDEAVLLAGNNANGIFPVKYYKGKFNAYQRTYVITPIDKDRVSVRWLYFRIKHVTAELQKMSVGTATKFLTKKILDAYEIILPPISEQIEVANILWSLQKKIDLNHQTNQTLEEIAQAIFKSWFVDFEPTRAKIAAKKRWLALNEVIETSSPTCYSHEFDTDKPNTQSLAEAMTQAAMAAISGKTPEELARLSDEQQQHLRGVAALFPDTLVDSELGEIPERWTPSKLGKHFNVVMGQSPSGDTYNTTGIGMLFFQGRRDFRFRFPTPRVYTTAPNRIAKTGDTLISVRAPVGDRNMALRDCCIGRGVAAIRHKTGARSFTYAFIGHIEKLLSASGSDGTVFSSINKNELSSVDFLAPTEDLLAFYETHVSVIDQRIELNSLELNTLEEIRDTLLPKLLSGEITLQDSDSEQNAQC